MENLWYQNEKNIRKKKIPQKHRKLGKLKKASPVFSLSGQKNQKFGPIAEYPRIDTINRSINCNHFKTQHEGFKSSGSQVTTFEKFVKSG